MGDELTTEDLTGRATTQTRDGERAESAERTESADAADRPEGQAQDGADEARTTDRNAATRTDEAANQPLLERGDAQDFEARWHEIQVAFVDEPRAAVERADNLVAELMRHLAETFADERRGLEEAWSAGEDVDTENLRVALTRYRSFFQRLLAT